MENAQQHINFDLLAKFFANECSIEEAQNVELWRNSSAENATEFARLQKIFSANFPDFDLDADLAWKKVDRRISEEDKQKIHSLPETDKAQKPNWFLRIAAVLVFTILFYFIAQQFNFSNKSIAYSADNESATVALSDGSTVEMNAKTTMIFTDNTQNSTREIELSGEAFFDVKRDVEKPFIINTEYLEIEVLGTSFNVLSMPETDSAKVSVSTGTVKVSIKGKQELVILTAGESVVYNASGQKFVKTEGRNENEMYWRTGILEFRNQKLKSVAEAISQNFGVEIIVATEVENCKISASFNNDSLETILEVIATTLQLKVEQKQNGYVFKGEGC